MYLFSLMLIVVCVFRFVSYSYSLSTRAAVGVYLVNSTYRLRFTRSDNISFSHLIWMALSLGIWGQETYILTFCHKILVDFALLIEGRLFSIGWRNPLPISVSFKKRIVLQK